MHLALEAVAPAGCDVDVIRCDHIGSAARAGRGAAERHLRAGRRAHEILGRGREVSRCGAAAEDVGALSQAIPPDSVDFEIDAAAEDHEQGLFTDRNAGFLAARREVDDLQLEPF